MKEANVIPDADNNLLFTDIPLEALQQRATTEGTITLLDVLGIHQDAIEAPTPHDATVKTSWGGEDAPSI